MQEEEDVEFEEKNEKQQEDIFDSDFDDDVSTLQFHPRSHQHLVMAQAQGPDPSPSVKCGSNPCSG